MTQGVRDVYSGGVLLVLSIALFFVIPGQVETTVSDTLTPAFVPTTITVLIAALSAVLLVQGLRSRAQETGGGNETITSGGLGYVAVTIGVIIAYAAAIPWLGYIPATAAVLLGLATLYGNRNWKQIVIIMVIAPPVIMVFFRYTMLVLLPEGKLFG